MKAVRIHHYGGPEVLTCEDAPRPRPGPGEVLVRTVAIGANPLDDRVRRGGAVARYWTDPFPLILGWTFSGVVEECAADVADIAPDDEVCGFIRFPAAGGCYAEYVAAPAAQITRKPSSVDHVHAAALPLSGLAAWQMFEAAGLTPGQRVLVHAAAGGVGHLAVQIAKWRGAEVVATASAANEGFVRALGADQFIDYTMTPFDEVVADIDVQLDTVGREVQARCWSVMKRGGAVVTIVPEAGPLSQEHAAAHGVAASTVIARPDAVALERLLSLAADGVLRVAVEEVLPLADAAVAHRRLATGHGRGKIVLAT